MCVVLCILTRRGLVEDDDRRAHRDDGGDSHEFAHGETDSIGMLFDELLESEELDNLVDSLGDLIRARRCCATNSSSMRTVRANSWWFAWNTHPTWAAIC